MKKFVCMLVIILLLSNTFCMATSPSWEQTWEFKPGLIFEGLNGSFSETLSQYLDENDSTIGKIMGYLSIILIIARFLCLAVMLIMGMRYMFAGPEKRAELKTRSISLFVGLVVIFGSSYIMSLVIGFINDYVNQSL